MSFKENREFNSIAVFFICVLFGLACMTEGIAVISKSLMAQKWPTTNGEIIESNFQWEESPHVTNDGSGAGAYKLNIQYTYFVDNQRYYSDQMGPKGLFFPLGQETNFQTRAEAIVKQLPKGKQVTVWYNPIDPKEAVLSVQIRFLYFLVVMLGAFMMYLGYGLYIKEKKEMRGKKRSEPINV